MEADLDQVQQERLMQWCVDVLGPCELLSEDKRIHGRSGVHRIGAASGRYYLKIYREASPWELEVHCYEQWAQAFGNHAPRLIALHEEAPLAILVSELPGEILLKADLSPEQERRVWTAAGQALANLHNLTTGVHFGPCHRDGSVVGRKISDPVQYVSAEFARLIAAGSKGGYLTAEELAVIREVDAMLPAFVGERPVPCHRDYGPDNWSVTSEGAWSGVIDFEFAYWDLRVADFSRYPHWSGSGGRIFSRPSLPDTADPLPPRRRSSVWPCGFSMPWEPSSGAGKTPSLDSKGKVERPSDTLPGCYRLVVSEGIAGGRIGLQ